MRAFIAAAVQTAPVAGPLSPEVVRANAKRRHPGADVAGPGSSVGQGFDHLADRNLDLIRRYRDDLERPAASLFPHLTVG